MKTTDFIKQVQKKEIDIVEHTHKVIEEAKKINKEYNHFNVISENLAIKQAEKLKKDPKGRLAGLSISVKDCICVKDIESTAGSKILKGYKPLFNATVIEKLIKEGAIIIGKTAQDEFGFGSFSVNVGLDKKIPLNPNDKERVTGGSSGGSAAFTKITNYPHISLAESTGGSIVNPASFCGVAGLCPTYGLVSRYGLIDYANSLDKIGPMAKNVSDLRLSLDIISGHDENDSTSLNQQLNKDDKVKKIAIIKETFDINDEIKNPILKKLDDYETISLPLVEKYGIETYYIIALSEASTNLAKYAGLRYGIQEDPNLDFNEYFSKVRSENFGKEAKRRIILGTFARMSGFRDAYYLKAMKLRTLIINEYKKAFKKYDVLISPTMPMIAPKIKEVQNIDPLDAYKMDIMTVGPNLAGIPHLSINIGSHQNMPIGMMLMSDHLNENKILNLGEKLQ